MKITVFENLLLFPRKSKSPNIETKNLLHLLQTDKKLPPIIKQLREKYKIPQDGFTLRRLYESDEIRDNRIKGLSIDKNEQYYSIMHEYEDDESFYNELYKNEYSKTKVKKLNEFYESLSPKGKKALKEYANSSGGGKLTSSDKKGLKLFDLFDEMRKDIIKITHRYNAAGFDELSFFLLVAFNSFLEVNTKTDFMFLTDKEEIIKEIDDFNHPFGAIIIDQQTSKRKLKKWIDDSWFLISKNLEKLPKPYFNRSRILGISKEIFNLRENRKLSYKDISKHLLEKYPDDDRVYDEGWIKETYHRYTRMLHEFLKRNKT